MPKQTLRHQLPDGTIATRQTARAYTHVVVSRSILADSRKVAQSKATREAYARDAGFYLKRVALGVGGLWHFGNGCPPQELTESAVAESERRLAGASTVEEYVEARVAAALAKIGDGEFGPWEAAGWSASAHNAEKRANEERGHGREAHVETINNGAR